VDAREASQDLRNPNDSAGTFRDATYRRKSQVGDLESLSSHTCSGVRELGEYRVSDFDKLPDKNATISTARVALLSIRLSRERTQHSLKHDSSSHGRGPLT
jgi:hypothetical protein